MTGYTVHTGSSEKFCEGWDQIFKQASQQTPSKKADKPVAKKVAQPKQAAKKLKPKS